MNNTNYIAIWRCLMLIKMKRANKGMECDNMVEKMIKVENKKDFQKKEKWVMI